MSDVLDGIIVGAAAAAIGTIVAMKFFNRTPPGGGEPSQPDVQRSVYPGQTGNYVIAPEALALSPDTAAPVANNIPIAEAAFSNPTSMGVDYAPATGYDTNRAELEALLPQ